MLRVSKPPPDVQYVGRIILSVGQSDSFLYCVLLLQSASYLLNIQHVWSLAGCVSQTGSTVVKHAVCRTWFLSNIIIVGVVITSNWNEGLFYWSLKFHNSYSSNILGPNMVTFSDMETILRRGTTASLFSASAPKRHVFTADESQGGSQATLL